MKNLKKLLTVILLVFTCVFIVPEFCANSPGTKMIEAEAATPKMKKMKLTMLKGRKQRLRLDAGSTTQKVRWISSNPSVATVSSRGLIRTLKKGRTVIKAKVSRRKVLLKCYLTVEAPKLSKTRLTLTEGSTFTLKMLGTVQKVKWRSSDRKIVTVSSRGKVRARKPGKATIRATIGRRIFKCRVRVKAEEKKPDADKMIFLTFDDGPSSHITPRLLSVLSRYHAKATFFVVGSCAAQNPDLVRQEFKAGHTIGIHSYSHVYSTIYASSEAFMRELHRTQSLLISLTGVKPRFFRFPGGGNNHYVSSYVRAGILSSAHQEGYTAMDWNAATNDAVGISYSKDQMVQFGISTINSALSRGKQPVVLIHDADTKSYTPYVVEQILKYYTERGYVFCGLNDYTGGEICFAK